MEETIMKVRGRPGILVEMKGMLLFSSLAHALAMGVMVLLVAYLPHREPSVVPIYTVNLVELPSPTPKSEPKKKVRPIREVTPRREKAKEVFLPKPKEEKPREVQNRSKPAPMAQAKLLPEPKAAPSQEAVQATPKETLKPSAQESAPPPVQPKSWSVAQQLPVSPNPGSAPPSALRKLLSSEPAQGSGANPSSTLLAQPPGRPQKEEIYRPSAPSARESGPPPREVGGLQEGDPTGRGLTKGRGPASGIDRLSAGLGGTEGQVAGGTGGGWGGGHGGKGSGFQGGKTGRGAPGGLGGGGTGTGSYGEGTGFRAPSRPISIGPPSKGGLGGLDGAPGGGKYIPLNTDDPDLGPYMAYLKERIERFWSSPEGAETLKGDVVLAFTVERDGSLSRARVITSSGYRILDRAVVDAVNRAAPFRPIPEEIKEKRLSPIGTFHYK
ncbi:MAG: TonB family protein [Nitrospinae bacterium]|nr:TonB family protein [Nitrospinota bacterium]